MESRDYNTKSGGHGLYTCEICKETFQKKKQLKDHMHKHTNFKVKDLSEGNSNIFSQSIASTLMESIEFKHIDLELTPSTFGEITTEELLRGSTLAQDLSNYYRIKKLMKSQDKEENKCVSSDRKYICEVCQKGFKKISHLKDHLRSHTGEKPFECPYPDCNLSFSTSGSRKRHLITHTGEKPYSCPHCNKSFQRIGLCEAHIKAHLENPKSLLESEIAKAKPFKCPQPYCGVRLSRKSTLIRHLLMHAGKLPYACPDCGKSFKTWSIKKKHCEEECPLRHHDCAQMPSLYPSADRQQSAVHPATAGPGSAVHPNHPGMNNLPNPYVKLIRFEKDINSLLISRGIINGRTSAQAAPQSADRWAAPQNVPHAPEELYYYQLGIKDPFLRAVLIERAERSLTPSGHFLDPSGTCCPTPRGRRAGVSLPPHYFLCPGCGLRFGRKRSEIFGNHLRLKHGYSTEETNLQLLH